MSVNQQSYLPIHLYWSVSTATLAPVMHTYRSVHVKNVNDALQVDKSIQTTCAYWHELNSSAELMQRSVFNNRPSLLVALRWSILDDRPSLLVALRNPMLNIRPSLLVALRWLIFDHRTTLLVALRWPIFDNRPSLLLVLRIENWAGMWAWGRSITLYNTSHPWCLVMMIF